MAEFKVTSDPPDWLQAIRDKQQPVAEAAVAALREVSAESVQEGRKDIAAAGRFGKTWQEGLQYRTKGARKDNAASLQAQATIFHRYGIAGRVARAVACLFWLWFDRPVARGGSP